MSDPIREQVSAFLDGELPENETELLLKRLTRDCELRDRFGRYSLIGEALRGSERDIGPTRNFAAAVSRRIDPEPAENVPTGAPMSRRIWWQPLLGAALAAGVAVIAVVAWEQRAQVPQTAAVATHNSALASLASDARPREAVSYTVPAASLDAPVLSSARLTNYVFAHSKYSSLLGQRNMLSGLIAQQGSPEPVPDVQPVQTRAASGAP